MGSEEHGVLGGNIESRPPDGATFLPFRDARVGNSGHETRGVEATEGLKCPKPGLCPRDLSGFHQAPGDNTRGRASNQKNAEKLGARFFPHLCLPSSPPLGQGSGENGMLGWPRKPSPPKEQQRMSAGQEQSTKMWVTPVPGCLGLRLGVLWGVRGRHKRGLRQALSQAVC